MISMNEILKQIDYLPVFNKTAQKALGLLRDEFSSNKEIADVIKYDTGLTANILKLANSAYFAHTVEVKELSNAISFLGRDKIYQIVTLQSSSKYFKNLSEGYESDAGELWKHSISSGIIAEHLSYLEPNVNKGQLFSAAILHDIGKTILCLWVKDEWKVIQDLINNKKIGFAEAEKSVLGYTHCQVGGAILQRWMFPDDIVLSARNHHDEKIHSNPVVRITKLSDYMSIMMGYTTDGDNLQYGGYDELISYYKIKTSELEVILNNCFMIIQSVIDDFYKID